MASPFSHPDALAGLSEHLRPLAARGETKRFNKGHLLIEEGDSGATLFIILSGRLRAFSWGDRGREITYGTYGAGEYVGEMSLDGGLRSASVEVVERCVCVIVTRATLLEHIAQHPDFAIELLSKVIRRARAATLSAKQLALNDVYGRLVHLLNQIALPQGDGSRVVTERLTHRDMATQLGCSREMVSRLLKDLQTGRYITTIQGRLTLTRPLPMRW
jgi:CRP/FNR family transcriptional regulator, cyclic AMP receptor protein